MKPLKYLRDIILGLSIIWNSGQWLFGQSAWRDGPPEFTYFIFEWFTPLAVMAGLGIGELREKEHWRRIYGSTSLALTAMIFITILSDPQNLHVYNN